MFLKGMIYYIFFIACMEIYPCTNLEFKYWWIPCLSSYYWTCLNFWNYGFIKISFFLKWLYLNYLMCQKLWIHLNWQMILSFSFYIWINLHVYQLAISFYTNYLLFISHQHIWKRNHILYLLGYELWLLSFFGATSLWFHFPCSCIYFLLTSKCIVGVVQCLWLWLKSWQ